MAKEKNQSTNPIKEVNLARTIPTPNSSLKPSIIKPSNDNKSNSSQKK